MKSIKFRVICLVLMAQLMIAGQAYPAEPTGWQEFGAREFPLLLNRKENAFDRMTSEMKLPKPRMTRILELTMRMRGVPINYADENLRYFLNKGTDPVVLYTLLAELGITHQENEALASVDMNLAVGRVSQMNRWHLVTMATEVVEGRVTGVEAVEGGPFHTQVRLKVRNVLKSCSNVQDNDVLDLWLPVSGPYTNSHRRTYYRRDKSEPLFRLSDRVVVIAGSYPLNLSRKVLNLMTPFVDNRERPGSSDTERLEELWEDVDRNWGDVDELLRLISRPMPKKLELYDAYAVRRKNLVTHSDARRVPDPTDKIDKSYFEERVAEIFRAQRKYCKDRAALRQNR